MKKLYPGSTTGIGAIEDDQGNIHTDHMGIINTLTTHWQNTFQATPIDRHTLTHWLDIMEQRTATDTPLNSTQPNSNYKSTRDSIHELQPPAPHTSTINEHKKTSQHTHTKTIKQHNHTNHLITTTSFILAHIYNLGFNILDFHKHNTTGTFATNTSNSRLTLATTLHPDPTASLFRLGATLDTWPMKPCWQSHKHFPKTTSRTL